MSPTLGSESPSPGLGWVSVGLHRPFCGLLHQRMSRVYETRFLVDSVSDWGSSSCSWFPCELYPEWAVSSSDSVDTSCGNCGLF